MIEAQILFEDIKKRTEERLKFEGKHKDKQVVDPDGPFYNKPLEYGLKIFTYFMCFKCKKPYFGG